MTIVPIVFAFDYRVVVPAGVCFTTLLKSAKPGTFYDIFVLHGEGQLNKQYQIQLTRLQEVYPNCKFTFKDVGNAFQSIFTARGIPNATYYKILIAELIKQYDTIIVSDADIIFKGDLSGIYDEVDLGNNYIAAVRNPFVKVKYIRSFGCDPSSYAQCGFLILNLKAIRSDKMTDKLKELSENNYLYFDQDIFNIVFKNRITYISPRYNSTQGFFMAANSDLAKKTKYYSEKEIAEGLHPYVIHFNGKNPWQEICPRHDIWWAEYRESSYYEERFYFEHYYKLMHPPPQLLLRQLPKSILKKPFGKIYRKFFPY